MDKQPLPEQIRKVAGINEEITRQNRNQLLPRYIAAKTVLMDSGLCLQRGATEDPCSPCRLDDPDQRLCVLYKTVMKACEVQDL